jgi:hypothetical protein
MEGVAVVGARGCGLLAFVYTGRAACYAGLCMRTSRFATTLAVVEAVHASHLPSARRENGDMGLGWAQISSVAQRAIAKSDLRV